MNSTPGGGGGGGGGGSASYASQERLNCHITNSPLVGYPEKIYTIAGHSLLIQDIAVLHMTHYILMAVHFGICYM